MGKPRLLFVYNPNAGKAKIGAGLSSYISIFSEAGYEVIAYPTRQALDAKETVLDYLERRACDRIVCAGGDGTLNEVVNGSMNSEYRVPIGYIPAGTTNDFAYSLGIPTEKTKAAELAVSGKEFFCDVGQFEEQYFTYTAAFGIFTEVSYDTPQNVKNALGRTAYILSGISSLTRVKPHHMRVEYDGGCIEDDFLYGMVANTSSVGGFRNLLPGEVILDDGYYEMLFIRMPQNLMDLNAIISELSIGKSEHKNIYHKRIKGLHFQAEQPVPWTLDGEFGGEHTEGTIQVLPRAISYIVGEDAE
ncbi:MAG: diacylglycerol/lipid kinase family protein [Lachnospiraceae bacterium]